MKKTARFWATLDLIVTAIMAFPVSAELLLRIVYALSNQTPPAPDPLRLFFVCLAGALGVLWAIARLYDPQRRLVMMDSIGRTWVACLILWFVFGKSAPIGLLLFVVTEIGGAIHQAHELRKERRDSASLASPAQDS